MPTLTSQIVNVQAQVVSAPLPSTLQGSGAFVSVGGTTASANTLTYYGTSALITAAQSGSGNSVEIGHMASTFFAQNNNIGVYILELGALSGVVATQIAALATWIAANPGQIYAYLTPFTWDASGATLNTLATTYNGPTAQTYFFVTTTSSTYTAYTAVNKSIAAMVASPTAGATEFQAASYFSEFLANNPSAANPMAPMNLRFMFGVTAWALTGASGGTNGATVTTLLSAYVNVILNGAEGGFSNTLLRNGTFNDGNQMMFWWAVDYVCIQSKQQLAAALIAATNSGTPIVYNQFGINSLLSVLNNIGTNAISDLILLSATFTAVPFATYTNANPSNYAAGIYQGFAATVTPQLGFTQITFYLTATNFT